ncbi:glycosyltransferase [Facilibium subflavum]|uniref:glycosyltransferase n=1 Tax=Facilibium subflavum TaxID=2219058 RepID=UPI000E652F7D|nr:glycosyltransferase [Facilibium subflavum]
MKLCDIDQLKPQVSKNKTCYIIASGPSINTLPLHLLKGHDTIAVNGAIAPLNEYGVKPFIHCVVDTDFISKRQNLCLLGLKTSRFFATNDECYHKLKKKLWFSRNKNNVVSFPNKTEKTLDHNIKTGYVEGGTVVAVALQLAIFLGYERIFIAGMDLSSTNMRAYKEIRKRPSYLDQCYTTLIEPFFIKLSDYARKNHISIYNNSLESRLPDSIIPKRPFIDSFKSNRRTMPINIITPGVKYGGGMERYICELIENLSKKGYQITAYCLKHDKKLFAGNSKITVKQSKIIKHFPRFLKYFAFAMKVWLSTRKTQAVNIATARIFNADLAIVGGTHQAHNKIMGKKNGLYDKIEIFLEKRMYKNAKKIMAHSDLMVDEINAYGLGIEKKIRMCFPPVSNNAFYYVPKEQKKQYKQKLGLPTDKFILLTPGGEPVRKGTPHIIEALKQLDPNLFFLVILGKNKPLELPENAKFFGLVDNVQDYYAAAEITIAPSIYEPFGLVVIESLEVGTPVIISKNLGSKSFVTPENGIIIDEVTPQAIKHAILKAHESIFHCSEGFIEKQKLTWDNHIKQLEAML